MSWNSIFMVEVWWVGMGLNWNMKEVGYKGWQNINTCMIIITWFFDYVCGQYVIPWNL